MKHVLAGVMALTLVSSVATADEPPAAPPAPTMSAPAATPLATRPSKPLTLASANEGTPFGYKLLAGLGVAAAAGIWLKKRRGTKPKTVASRIEVLGRTSLGMRSELLVVHVEGTRLLIGMTPSAIQTLAILDSTEVEVPAEAATDAQLERQPLFEVADRARALLNGTRSGAKTPAYAKRVLPAPKPRSRVAGQAKGLMLALEQPDDEEDVDSGDERTERKTLGRSIRLGDL